MKTHLAAAAAALLITSMAAPAYAQNTADPSMATQSAPAEDDGFDMGWLGLLGLAGLLGLRRKADVKAGSRDTATRPV